MGCIREDSKCEGPEVGAPGGPWAGAGLRRGLHRRSSRWQGPEL